MQGLTLTKLWYQNARSVEVVESNDNPPLLPVKALVTTLLLQRIALGENFAVMVGAFAWRQGVDLWTSGWQGLGFVNRQLRCLTLVRTYQLRTTTVTRSIPEGGTSLGNQEFSMFGHMVQVVRLSRQ